MAQLKHHFLIDGIRHRAWLARRDGGYVLIDDEETAVQLDDAQLSLGAQRRDILVARDGDRIFIHLDGRDYEVVYESASAVFEHEAEATGDAIARAPMPGAVVVTHVKPGQQVAEGEVLVVIESMKLETSIAAPRAGMVETLHVSVGQTFDRDAPLVTLAPLPEA